MKVADTSVAAPLTGDRGADAPVRAVLVGLIGAGIQASRTPALHEREGAAQGLTYIYKIIDLDAERAKRAGEQSIRSEAQTLDPDRILAALTERRPTFTRADLNRQMKEFLPDARARSAFTDRILEHEAVIPLREGADAPVPQGTTQAYCSARAEALAALGSPSRGNQFCTP